MIRLEYEPEAETETGGAGSRKGSFSSITSRLRITSQRDEDLRYLDIQFLTSADKKKFLEYWPGGVTVRGQQPSDLLNQVRSNSERSISELSESLAPAPELPGT